MVVKYRFQGIYFLYYLFWIILVVSFILIAFFVSFPRYLQVVGIVVWEEEYYVKMYLEDDQIMHLQSAILILDDKKIPFEIVRISDTYYLDEKKYREVLLHFEMEEERKIENNLLSLSFILENKTWIQTLQEIWRKSYL